jgi:hypothetical protein
MAPFSQRDSPAPTHVPPCSSVSSVHTRQVTELKLLQKLGWDNCYVKANADESPVGSCLTA